MVRTKIFDGWVFSANDSHVSGLGQLDNGFNYEPHVRRKLEEVLPGAVGFLDIGANAGIHTISAKSIKKDLVTVSIEADPENVEVLCRNLAQNACENAFVLPFAVGDFDGLVFRDKDPGNPSMLEESNESRIATPCWRLDSVVLPPIDVVKIDVEGFELRVLKGAEKTFRNKPMVMFEYCQDFLWRSKATAEDLLSWFFERGYALKRMGNREVWEGLEAALDGLEGVEITDVLAFSPT